MKSFVITSAALLVFAGSTLSISAAAKPKSSTTQPQPSQTDAAVCPPNTPNGCGIYDGTSK